MIRYSQAVLQSLPHMGPPSPLKPGSRSPHPSHTQVAHYYLFFPPLPPPYACASRLVILAASL